MDSKSLYFKWDKISSLSSVDLLISEAWQISSITVRNDSSAPNIRKNIIVKAFFWNEKDNLNSIASNEIGQVGTLLGVDQYQTVLCIAFGTDGTTINQAAEMVEDVF